MIDSAIFNVTIGTNSPTVVLNRSYVPYSDVVNIFVYNGTNRKDKAFAPNCPIVSIPTFFTDTSNWISFKYYRPLRLDYIHELYYLYSFRLKNGPVPFLAHRGSFSLLHLCFLLF